MRRLPMRAAWRVVLALITGTLVLTSGAGASGASGRVGPATQSSDSCTLHTGGGPIKHVIAITFDNVHFSRDNPAVPSDLEQMPNLLNFITGGGALISYQHTPLIAHTGTNILSVLTGLYGDKMGQPVTNAFGFYDTDRAASFRSSFAYWTSRLGATNDNTFYMTTDGGRNTPAPWVPFTRAGCSFGAVAMTNTVLENTRFDIPAVFGPGSREAQEEREAASMPCGFGSNPPCTPDQQKAKNRPQTDLVGIAVHCGRSDRACSTARGARPDALLDEPGGYVGLSALFGARYADPFISPNAPVTDLDGNVIADGTGNPGFPGFGAMTASTSLGFVAAMQERGIPVTYAYISDAHDDRQTDRAFGPGQAGYVQALERYDRAFGQFFAQPGRLRRRSRRLRLPADR